MKKFYKLLLSLLLLIMLCGCDIYVYDIGESNQNKDDSSQNLTQNGTGSTIVNDDINYTGTTDYTSQEPNSNNSWDEIYDKVKTSVVTIRNLENGEIVARGSGVFFSQDATAPGYAYIYTNAHVVKGSTSIEVVLSNKIVIEGKLIGYDENEDVAVVQIPKRSDYTVATLRNSDTLKIGEEILAIGSPIGEKYSETATSGIISNVNIAITTDNTSYPLYLIQIDAALNPGNSGGPLFDKSGNLIGINTLRLLSSGNTTNIESFNYSIPISHFSLVANYLLKGDLYYRPFISISVTDITSLSLIQRESYGVTINHGLLLTTIDPQSPLYGKANINQVITHIEGIQVFKSSDFSVELLKHAPEDTITLTICNANGTNSRDVDIKLLKR